MSYDWAAHTGSPRTLVERRSLSISEPDAERRRLRHRFPTGEGWKKWGPYLSERQWGTVREDYSAHGNAWEYFPHDHARSRAYRWGEDGIAGFSDAQQRLCLALALWNGRDPILKERLFGLTNAEGNHGEDVKELYYYLDATPSHSYLKMLYKYPQGEFPYAHLLHENRTRGIGSPEYELIDTGAFDDDCYFDVTIEYAQAAPDDVLMRVTVDNRGPDAAALHLLPQLWFRNTWSWFDNAPRPNLSLAAPALIAAHHPELGSYRLHWDDAEATPLFCDNDSNPARLWNDTTRHGYWKDAFHQRIVHAEQDAVNPMHAGTKAAIWSRHIVRARGRIQLRLRLRRQAAHGAGAGPAAGASTGASTGASAGASTAASTAAAADATAVTAAFDDFDATFAERVREADEFYAQLQQGVASEDARAVQRQAYAGMIWSKQFYYLDIPQWLRGDPTQPAPPPERRQGRNREWMHLNNADIISMPDKWEYPWYAAWDLAFHCIALAELDAEFAKEQLLLLTREWYMHPNGQMPAYEWAFGDVNPPVHAWASWRVFQIDRRQRGNGGDLDFLERVFHKLMLNFTWWVNRKDAEGRNVFQGGFLGLDNIGVFDRSRELPTGGHIDQSDGTAWMAMYALNLMRIALELALYNRVYEDIATKFLEHFLQVAEAMNHIGGEDGGNDGVGLWDDEDQFYYDVLHLPDGSMQPLKVRSLVGLIPLFAVETLEPELLDRLPDFKRRLEWFLNYRPDLAALVSHWSVEGRGHRRLLSLLRGHRMKRILKRMLDESEFLSPYGIRAISRVHAHAPYAYRHQDMELTVRYQPAESDSGLFGGNSNWRGPIWFPVNFLIIESLQRFHHYYGDDFRIECPSGSGRFMSIRDVANELARRLTGIFLRDERGLRPVHAQHPRAQTDIHFRDLLLFYEYFDGDTGRGVGASHQTGWTGLVARLLMPRYTPDGNR